MKATKKRAGKPNEGTRICADWHLIARDKETGLIVHESEEKNLVTIIGKGILLGRLFGLSGVGAMVALGVGSGSTSAANGDTRLATEAIANATRLALTNSAGAGLTSGDVVTDTQTIGGVIYYQKIVVKGVMLAGDANTGNIQEFGLFDTSTLPGSPTGTSGNMFNHYVAGSAINKTTSIEIDILITLRS